MKKLNMTGKCYCGSTRFNANVHNKIRFKITEKGRKIYHGTQIVYGEKTYPNILIDEDGYIEMLLFKFIQIFGCWFSNMQDLPIENDFILIDELQEQINNSTRTAGETK